MQILIGCAGEALYVSVSVVTVMNPYEARPVPLASQDPDFVEKRGNEGNESAARLEVHYNLIMDNELWRLRGVLERARLGIQPANLCSSQVLCREITYQFGLMAFQT